MMWWNGSWTWAWLVMVPMMIAMWGLLIWVVTRWTRDPNSRSPSPTERLDGRLAAGDIDVEEYRARRAELERR